MLAELKTGLADVERDVQAVEGRDDDLASMVAGLNRAFGFSAGVREEERPRTAARLLATIEDAPRRDPVGFPGGT